MPSCNVHTTVIGPRGLLHDSLVSLLSSYSYRVTGSHHTAADMPRPPVEEGQHLVLLTARTADAAVVECAVIRQTCPNCKIIGLLEGILDEDFQKLAHSAIDGCVPLNVSQDVLIRTLDLVMSDAARFVVLAEPHLSTPPSAEGPKKLDPKSGPSSYDRSRLNGMSESPADQDVPPLVPNDMANSVSEPTISVSSVNPATAKAPGFSGREKQIVGGVIKGQSNKVIARAFGISEATVKAHMKAILSKLPCSNRTQLAIWALDHITAFTAPAPTG